MMRKWLFLILYVPFGMNAMKRAHDHESRVISDTQSAENYTQLIQDELDQELLIVCSSNEYMSHAVAQLLEQGACVDGVEGQESPLYAAIRTNHGPKAQLLLNRGARLYNIAPGEISALHLASMYNRIGIARMLLNRGHNLNVLDANGATPLHKACFFEHTTDIVQMLLAHKDIQVNQADNDGYTPLHTERRLNKVQLLLAHGADIEATTRYERATPLMYAAWRGDGDIVQYLIEEASADLHAVDKYNRTALDHARQAGHDQVANILRAVMHR